MENINSAPSFLQLKTATSAFLSLFSAFSAVETIEITVRSVNVNHLNVTLYKYVLFEIFAYFELFPLDSNHGFFEHKQNFLGRILGNASYALKLSAERGYDGKRL